MIRFPRYNFFKIDGPASIAFSGGRTSGMMLCLILDAYNGNLPKDFHVNFENTGDECEATLRFVRKCAKFWRVKVNWLEWDDEFRASNYRNADGSFNERRHDYKKGEGYRIVSFATASRNGEPFDRMLKYYATYRKIVKGLPPVLPNVAQRMCTANLKIKTNERFMRSLGYQEYERVLGMRYDEPRRFAKLNSQGHYVMPLYEARITKPDVMKFWSKMPFDLEIDAKSEEGNCRYCFLKRVPVLLRIMRKDIAASNGNGLPPALKRMLIREREADAVFRNNRLPYKELVKIAKSDAPIIDNFEEKIVDCICGEAS